MPKVSPEHKAARRAQIVAAARRCFARNGFHATSMDDVIGEAGLSAGAVYRYFPGKDALVVATIEDTLDVLHTLVGPSLREATSPGQAVESVLRNALHELGDPGDASLTRVALFAWAEAHRNPAVHQAVSSRYRKLRGMMEDGATRWLDAAGADADAADIMAKAIFSALLGTVAQLALLGDVTPSDIRGGLDAFGSLGQPGAD